MVALMRYYSYNVFDDNLGLGSVKTISEDEIRETYYSYWYEQMCKEYGKEYTDATFCFEDYLEEWQVVNWAWEVTK